MSATNERIPTDVNPAFSSMFIVQPLAVRSMAALFSTHPAPEQRIAALLKQAEEMSRSGSRAA